AKRMRKACREQGIKSLRVLYSTEEPVRAVSDTAMGRHAPGSMAFVPPVAGMMMAGDIVKHLIRG
ncbi:MAG TPA: tRNA threonylcarbamoyladenosine dehydratase, partial [Clostridia bacterium]|nr:tRNA threonylcarbamoyladenosine dehydratase [Clostridia bacterium]